jgi:hypothetical protein
MSLVSALGRPWSSVVDPARLLATLRLGIFDEILGQAILCRFDPTLERRGCGCIELKRGLFTQKKKLSSDQKKTQT